MTPVLIDKSKDTLKRYEKLWNKIRYLTRLITNKLDKFDEKLMEIKFNLDDNLSLRKTLELRT